VSLFTTFKLLSQLTNIERLLHECCGVGGLPTLYILKLIHPVVLVYVQEVNRQTIRIQLCKIIIYSAYVSFHVGLSSG